MFFGGLSRVGGNKTEIWVFEIYLQISLHFNITWSAFPCVRLSNHVSFHLSGTVYVQPQTPVQLRVLSRVLVDASHSMSCFWSQSKRLTEFQRCGRVQSGSSGFGKIIFKLAWISLHFNLACALIKTVWSDFLPVHLSKFRTILFFYSSILLSNQ